MRWSTTEITREPAKSNFSLFCEKISDMRPWSEIRREVDWRGFHLAVKSGALPKPSVQPICRRAS